MKIDFENLLPINRKFRVIEFYYSKDNSSSRIENYKCMYDTLHLQLYMQYHDSIFGNFKQFLY